MGLWRNADLGRLDGLGGLFSCDRRDFLRRWRGAAGALGDLGDLIVGKGDRTMGALGSNMDGNKVRAPVCGSYRA